MSALQSVPGTVCASVNLCSNHAIVSRIRQVKHSYRLAEISGNKRQHIHRVFDAVAHGISNSKMPASGIFHPLVGQYELQTVGGSTINVAIDSQDSGVVASEALLTWSDIYFKTNMWPSKAYSSKVVAMPNCNPLTLDYIPTLRQLRQRRREHRVFCFIRVWGGTDEISGVEHNLRLIEAVNRAKCPKTVLAYLVTGKSVEIENRLNSQNIPFTYQPMKRLLLWETAASASINIIRSGMHGCVPWRMTDMLGMGTCTAMDAKPNTAWPVPLLPNQTFVDLRCSDQQTFIGDAPGTYEQIPDLLESLVNNTALVEQVSKNSADYFDTYLTPEAIGQYILDELSRRF